MRARVRLACTGWMCIVRLHCWTEYVLIVSNTGYVLIVSNTEYMLIVSNTEYVLILAYINTRLNHEMYLYHPWLSRVLM